MESSFNVEQFVKSQVNEVKSKVGAEKAMIAISGGVDSTTCAAIVHKAIGSNLKPVFIDTGFMRLDEPESVRRALSKPPLKLRLKIVRAKHEFMKALDGIENAEEKRKAFRETMYTILGDNAKKEACRFLVQGTIAPDWIETKGGIKTQHNVLEQLGIRTLEKYGFTLIEPLVSLYKDQVRQVARYLRVGERFSERQPFPGPGLVVRCVGRTNLSKLRALKIATKMVEKGLADQGAQQYFAVVLENRFENGQLSDGVQALASRFLDVNPDDVEVKVFRDCATGVKGDERAYGKVAGIRLARNRRKNIGGGVPRLVDLESQVTSSFPEIIRVLYLVDERKHVSKYSVVIRSIDTRDFMTADVTSIELNILSRVASNLLRTVKSASSVYYDTTPKPPATVEFE